MNEHPILFSTPMVQAILEGRKTMTRRIIKDKQTLATVEVFNGKNGCENLCLYGHPGDLLWVRECFTEWPKGEFQYKASTVPGDELGIWKPSIHMPKAAARIWLQVEEIRVERLQDISEKDTISEGVKYDFHAGENHFYVYPPKDETKGIYIGPCLVSGTYVSVSSAFGGDTPWKFSFKSLINKIHGEGTWEKNPWVWVVKFKVLSTTGKSSLP